MTRGMARHTRKFSFRTVQQMKTTVKRELSIPEAYAFREWLDDYLETGEGTKEAKGVKQSGTRQMDL